MRVVYLDLGGLQAGRPGKAPVRTSSTMWAYEGTVVPWTPVAGATVMPVEAHAAPPIARARTSTPPTGLA